MMIFDRTEKILGKEKAVALQDKHVLVVGIGGVGGYACEAISRSGIGSITIIDNDIISESNINRQIIALNSSIGRLKVDAMEERLNNINPDLFVEKISCSFSKDLNLDLKKYDYIIDAIDSIDSKIYLINLSFKYNVPIISSMGMGKRIHPEKLKIEYLKNTYNCPIAKKMRKNLDKNIVNKLKVVYSTEDPIDTDGIGSMVFVPATCGMLMASYVINEFCNLK